MLGNRAPVLTLWAAVVAERLGFDRAAALTLGKAVAGLNAQAKGRRLHLFEKPAAEPSKKKAPCSPPSAPRWKRSRRRIAPPSWPHTRTACTRSSVRRSPRASGAGAPGGASTSTPSAPSAAGV